MSAVPIGTNYGAESLRQKLHRMDNPATAGDFAIDNVFGNPGTKYPNNAPNAPVEGTLSKLVEGHNAFIEDIAALREEMKRRPFG